MHQQIAWPPDYEVWRSDESSVTATLPTHLNHGSYPETPLQSPGAGVIDRRRNYGGALLPTVCPHRTSCSEQYS